MDIHRNVFQSLFQIYLSFFSHSAFSIVSVREMCLKRIGFYQCFIYSHIHTHIYITIKNILFSLLSVGFMVSQEYNPLSIFFAISCGLKQASFFF